VTPMDVLNVVLAFFPWGFTKLAILILVLIYIVFSAVIVRQEQLMSKVVEIPFSPILRVAALAHLFASIGAFGLALILL